MKNQINKILIILIVVSFVGGIFIGKATAPIKNIDVPTDISIQLAKQITVLRPSYMTAQELDNFVKGTPLYGYGKYFLQVEKETGIGADILLSIACHESNYGRNGWSKSVKWNGKYYPCNQIFSWGITSSGAHIYSFYRSKRECIVGGINPITDKYQEGVPSLIKELYLTPSGAYYSGKTLYAISIHYASDKYWASGVENILERIPRTEEEKAKEWAVASKVFKPLDVDKGIEEPKDYWTKELTKKDFTIILFRLNGK